MPCWAEAGFGKRGVAERRVLLRSQIFPYKDVLFALKQTLLSHVHVNIWFWQLWQVFCNKNHALKLRLQQTCVSIFTKTSQRISKNVSRFYYFLISWHSLPLQWCKVEFICACVCVWLVTERDTRQILLLFIGLTHWSWAEITHRATMQSHWLHTAKQLDKSHYTQGGCYSSNDFNSSVVAQAVKRREKEKDEFKNPSKKQNWDQRFVSGKQMLKAVSVRLSWLLRARPNRCWHWSC